MKNINFDNLTAEEIGKLFPIQIVPYNPDWIALFEEEKASIIEILDENLTLNIEHIGSTSIAELAAKPTIDILIEISELTNEIKLIITKKLEDIGYRNMYSSEKEKSMTFGKGYDLDFVDIQTYHAHIREKSKMLQDEIYFRDYLRQNSNARDEYTKLKYALAEKHRFNREEYTRAKTEFIKKITEKYRKEILEK